MIVRLHQWVLINLMLMFVLQLLEIGGLLVLVVCTDVVQEHQRDDHPASQQEEVVVKMAVVQVLRNPTRSLSGRGVSLACRNAEIGSEERGQQEKH